MYNKRTTLTYFPIFFITLFTLLACQKEARLTPEKVYSGAVNMPQGWSKYDTAIQRFYDSTGTYISYRFGNESDLRFFIKDLPNTGILVPPAVYAMQVDSASQGDMDTLNFAVDYLINGLLRKSYPNKLLRQLLPYKILLYKYGRALTVNNAKLTGYDTAAISVALAGGPTLAANLMEGFNCLGLGIVRQAASFSFPTGYNAAASKTFHQSLWIGGATTQAGANGAVGKGRIPVPDGFKLTDYGTLVAQWTALPVPKNNLSVDTISSNNGTLIYTQTLLSDYANFINRIATNTRANFDNLYLTADYKGLRRRKRDAIVAFFKTEYNFDIENSWNR